MYIDTTCMKDCGKNITKLATELDVYIEDLYSLIQKMPEETLEWVGIASELFAKQAKDVEKKYAIELKNELNKFGEYLIDFSDAYEALTKR